MVVTMFYFFIFISDSRRSDNQSNPENSNQGGPSAPRSHNDGMCLNLSACLFFYVTCRVVGVVGSLALV
jgi:hypothetical protein